MFTKKIRQFSLLLIVAMLVAVVTSQVALGATTAQGGWYPTAMPTKNWNKPAATPTKNWNSWQPTPTKSWNKPAATPTKNWNSWQPTPTKSWNKPAATPTKSWSKPTATPVANQGQPEILSFEAKLLRSFPNGNDEIAIKWKAKNVAGRLVEVWANPAFISENAYSKVGASEGDIKFILTNDTIRIIDLALWIMETKPEGNVVIAKENISVTVGCKTPYFFEINQATGIGACPSGPAVSEKAVYQKFEHGFMLWIESTKTIEVYSEVPFDYQSGDQTPSYTYSPATVGFYEDTWDSSQPASDPTLQPPAGRYQPQYGFGKLWRDPKHSYIRRALGWATGAEIGYTKKSQQLAIVWMTQTLFFSTPENIVDLSGSGRYHPSSWRYLEKK